jgi:hypothetical protein
MTRIDLSARLKETPELISSELILETARKHGAGDQRERSMPTLAFFWSFLLAVEKKVHGGFYPAMSEMLQKLYGRDITKQGIQEQMERRDWRWLWDIYNALLKEYLPKLNAFESELLKGFADIRIADSTVISVVRALRSEFRQRLMILQRSRRTRSSA